MFHIVSKLACYMWIAFNLSCCYYWYQPFSRNEIITNTVTYILNNGNAHGHMTGSLSDHYIDRDNLHLLHIHVRGGSDNGYHGNRHPGQVCTQAHLCRSHSQSYNSTLSLNLDEDFEMT